MSTAGAGGKLVIRRRIAATREELFDAWTDPESMRLWMCPGDIVSSDVEMDLRVGGTFRINMRGPRESYEHGGEFIVIERPSKLAFTWIARATDEQTTLVTVEFFEAGRAFTELVLTHERFPRKEVRARYETGWGQIVDRLGRHLVGDA